MACFRLLIRSRFEAAHYLTSYQGSPEIVHGHSWRVEAILETDRLDDEGMAYDFVAIKRVLDELTARFDHGNINALDPFDRISPTTERLAEYFFAELVRRLPEAPIKEVTVWEGPDCSATFIDGVSGDHEA